jgi:hypothetical protein
MFYKFWVYRNIVSTEPMINESLLFNFYLPDQSLHGTDSKMKILYFYYTNQVITSESTTLSNNLSNRIGYHQLTTDTTTSKVGSAHTCPKFISPYNLYPFQIHHSHTGISIVKLDPTDYHLEGDDIFWAWIQPTNIKLYPLGAIIWSPAQHVVSGIVEILSENYRIVKNTKFKVPNNTLVKFVKKVYLDDRRCDRSQLSGKCRHMYHYAPRYQFVKFLVPHAKLDSNRVSQTSVDLKYRIRKQFKRFIPNYVHDIIIHISDNAVHTRNMERYVNETRHSSNLLEK